jgi:hypothetical protein
VPSCAAVAAGQGSYRGAPIGRSAYLPEPNADHAAQPPAETEADRNSAEGKLCASGWCRLRRRVKDTEWPVIALSFLTSHCL